MAKERRSRKPKTTGRPQRPQPRTRRTGKDPKKTALIIAIGAFFMIGGHYLYWEVDKILMRAQASNEAKESSQIIIDQFQNDVQNITKTSNPAHKTKKLKSAVQERLMPAKSIVKTDTKIYHEQIIKELSKAWGEWLKQDLQPQPKQPLIAKDGRKKIVIIIDDMGVSKKLSEETIKLPGPLTLAFLPYASGLKPMTGRAKNNGHELMIHMPMEPMNGKIDVGSIAILDKMGANQITTALDKAFNSFEGYIGLNNHMGSRVTQNQKIMDVVMAKLAQKDLLFVDSKTINSSVAGKTAARFGLNYAERDVFLDHHDTDEFVADSLQRVERLANRRGHAIAIGHPKRKTINALKEWLPTLKERGFDVVPISAIAHRAPHVTTRAK